jgi:hypothetical protein
MELVFLGRGRFTQRSVNRLGAGERILRTPEAMLQTL